MYTLRFANSAGRPTFPTYERSHGDLDSVALEILRVSEEVEGGLASYAPIVEDRDGKEVTRVPTASRRREVQENLAAPKTQVSGAVTRKRVGHKIMEVTEINGRYVSSRWVKDI